MVVCDVPGTYSTLCHVIVLCGRYITNNHCACRSVMCDVTHTHSVHERAMWLYMMSQVLTPPYVPLLCCVDVASQSPCMWACRVTCTPGVCTCDVYVWRYVC